MKNKTEKNWKKETCRDILALGSWIFYILIVARALIKPYRPFADQIIIAGAVLLLVSFFMKNCDYYIARGLILVIFTALFYQDKLFTGFVLAVLILALFSSYFVGNSKIKIGKGLIIGAVSTLVGYYLAGFSFGG